MEMSKYDKLPSEHTEYPEERDILFEEFKNALGNSYELRKMPTRTTLSPYVPWPAEFVTYIPSSTQ